MTCELCGAAFVAAGCAPGYAHHDAKNGHTIKICYDCCGRIGKEQLSRDGKGTLYLTQSDEIDHGAIGIDKPKAWFVGNWPGTLKIKCSAPRTSRHNIAGKRYDVWFQFDDATWHGVTYGDNTQICHVRRGGVKRKAA